jgi:hypothetical protein
MQEWYDLWQMSYLFSFAHYLYDYPLALFLAYSLETLLIEFGW